MNKARLCFFLCFFCFIGANAQVNYSFSAVSGTYTPISGTNPDIFQVNPGYSATDEGFANDLPIGFSFNYNGTAYTSISANTNGFASFKPFVSIADTAHQDYWFSDLYSGPYGPNDAIANRPLLAPLWDDQQLFSKNDLQYTTTGTAPSRVFTLQWSRVYWTLAAKQPGIEFQIKLYEGSNQIEFIYNQLNGAVEGTPFASIGITAEGSGNGNFLSLNNASSSPTASSTVNTNTINTKPASGQIYRFTPLTALPVRMSQFDVAKTACNITVSFTTSDEIKVGGYVVEVSKDGNVFGPLGEIPPSNAAQYSKSFPITEGIRNAYLFVRVKTVDKDGQFAYSPVRKISGECDKGKGFVLGLYPNPLASTTQLTVVSKEEFFNGRFNVSIIDLYGRIVLMKQIQLNNTSSFHVNVGNIVSGEYLIKVADESGSKSSVLHFIK